MRGEGISRETEKGAIYSNRCGAYLWKRSGEDEAICVSAMIGCGCSECQNLLSRFKLLRILDKHIGDIAITATKR
jgi:hypothetical protein